MLNIFLMWPFRVYNFNYLKRLLLDTKLSYPLLTIYLLVYTDDLFQNPFEWCLQQISSSDLFKINLIQYIKFCYLKVFYKKYGTLEHVKLSLICRNIFNF